MGHVVLLGLEPGIVLVGGLHPLGAVGVALVAVHLARQAAALAAGVGAQRRGRVGQAGPQAAAKVGMVRGHPRQIHHGGVHVHQFGQAVPHTGHQGYTFRRLDQQRYPHQILREGILALFRQARPALVIPMVAEKEDGAVVVDTGLFEAVAQAAELLVHLFAHGGVAGPQLIPVGFGVGLHALALADQGLDAGFALHRPGGAAGRQGRPVDGGEIRLLRLVGRVGPYEPQEHTQGLVPGHRGADAAQGGIHDLVVLAVVAAPAVGFQAALVVAEIVLAARLAPGVLPLRAGGGGLVAPVEHLVRMAGKGVRVLPGQKVVAGVHPHMVAGGFQFAEQAALLPVQHIPHGAVAVHMGVLPGEETAPAGHTDRVLAIGMPVAGRLSGRQRVQKGGLGGGVFSQMGQGVRPHLVRVEQDDMGSFGHGRAPFLYAPGLPRARNIQPL